MDDAKKRKVVIDCDTGVDDAIALTISLMRLDVLGITTVGGNVGLAYTQRNTRYVAETLGRSDVPVYAGYDRPMFCPLVDASSVHGAAGLGNLQIDEPRKKLERQHAVDYLIDTFMTRDDVSLITLGPLTNIAQALLKQPRLRERIPEILCMGGSLTCGNQSPAAEFNIKTDPEAAKIVFEAGIPIHMVGLNATRQWVVTDAFVQKVRALSGPAAELVAKLTEHIVKGRGTFCDAIAVMWWASDRVITKALKLHVDIETKGEFTRGMTLCDYRNWMSLDPKTEVSHDVQYAFNVYPEDPLNAEVAVEVDAERFETELLDVIASYAKENDL